MATFLGKEGVVKIGTHVLAEVKSFSINQSAATTEDTALGDSWTSYVVTQKSWQGSIACFWDNTDSQGQSALSVGTLVQLKLYPEGTTTGDYELSGDALITGVEMQQAHDGLVEVNFTYQGTGELVIHTAV